ncbi:hypothetical protein BUY79_12575 [Staphylococcus equorum]|uniref:hypothetical protein n=1 Tax=Staphylococcus equorum TaxID=246432 RepID=UPI000D1C99A0|nr:hypothetical protein [Staphylococcus equorum]PTE82516.1 hypothetical protein BUY79_12575 [Staphylococcus equorum]
MNKRQKNKRAKLNRSMAIGNSNHDEEIAEQRNKDEMYKGLAVEIEQLTASLKEFKDDLKEEHLQQLKEDMKKLKEAE